VLSATLEQGLRVYAIGDKLRVLRLSKKMGLVELGRHTGLSAALLSKIERGRLFPTLPTLLRIALVFGVGLEHFIAGDSKRNAVAVVRRRDRQRFPEKPGAKDVSFFFESLDFTAVERRLNAYYAEFEPVPAEKARAHQHAGVEFLYVLKGQLSLRVAGDDFILDGGDSVYFNSTRPHSYRRIGARPCSALVVSVP
jgi:transcriptional regulator with XRE-family HTH domain